MLFMIFLFNDPEINRITFFFVSILFLLVSHETSLTFTAFITICVCIRMSYRSTSSKPKEVLLSYHNFDIPLVVQFLYLYT